MELLKYSKKKSFYFHLYHFASTFANIGRSGRREKKNVWNYS
jgi:hypothetical protein